MTGLHEADVCSPEIGDNYLEDTRDQVIGVSITVCLSQFRCDSGRSCESRKVMRI